MANTVLPGLDGIHRQTRLQRIREMRHPEVKDTPILDVVVAPQLVEALLKRFPSLCPDESTSLEEIYRKQGEQRVVELLVRAVMQQQPEVL